jgi:hypothetical protein
LNLLDFLAKGYLDLVSKISKTDAIWALVPRDKSDLGMKVDLSPWLKDHFRNAKYIPDSDELMTLMAEAEMMKDGAKSIRPSVEICHAMASIELNISLADYAQPYFGLGVIIPRVLLEKNRDLLAVSWWKPGIGLYICMRDGSYLFHHLVGANWTGTIEELIRGKTDDENNVMDDDEQARFLVIGRICLNLALFAMTHHSLAPLSPDAQRRRDRAPRDERFARLAERDIQEVIVQDLDLVLAETADDQDASPQGRSKQAPNRRRGHWKMQPCGPGLASRKRIYVASYLVNAAGHRIDTQLS